MMKHQPVPKTYEPKPLARRAPPPPRLPPEKSALRKALHLDRILGASGIVAALCSASFAGYMLNDDDHEPYIFGREYLALFSRPSSFSHSASAAPPSRAGDAAPSAQQFDTAPTGSIGSGDPSARTDEIAPPKLLSTTKDHAWFSVAGGFEEVGPGDFVPKIGQIDSIRGQDGSWVVVLKDGSVLRAPDGNVSLPLASRKILGR
jgi:hypothetical protein